MQTRRLATVAVLAWAVAAACVDRHRTPLPGDGQLPLGWVDVRVDRGHVVEVSADGPVSLADGSGRVLRANLHLPGGSTLSRVDRRLALDGRPIADLPCELRPQASTVLTCAGVRYRGLIRLAADGSQLMALNRLSVDDYLLGVLPSEMPDRFGIEALKAQAVAARSYALAEQADRAWLFDDQRSQVYGGLDAESAMAAEAVRSTAQQILARGGKVITAWFHSTCGGSTTPARDVFDRPAKGVMERSVLCPDCRLSPTYSWSRRFAGRDVCVAFDIPGSRLDEVTTRPALFPGRPAEVTVRAGGESLTLTAKRFRSELSAGRPVAEQLLSTRWASAPRIVDGDLLIDGHGWGHGVGLCQHGAGGYASRGASYRAILDRYYPGAELVRIR